MVSEKALGLKLVKTDPEQFLVDLNSLIITQKVS